MTAAKERIREYFEATIHQRVGDADDIFALGLVDSMFGLQLVTFVENRFGIVVDGDELNIDNFSSINALSAFVEAKTSAAAGGA
ncbi:MAG: acyl carrier protein [Myxococcales bacterium]|nr:acyl carrier protein [Myxococcales bacterium]